MLPTVTKESIGARAIKWLGCNRRFFHPNELECIVALVRSVNPTTMLEIGVNNGRTAKVILANIPSIAWYFGIDTLPGYVPEKRVQRKERPNEPGALALGDPRFTLMLRQNGSLDIGWDDFGGPLDVVFIDGDHGRRAVTHDTDLALKIVRPGGIIIWHDYHNRGTVDVCDVLHEYATAGLAIQNIENTWLAFCRR